MEAVICFCVGSVIISLFSITLSLKKIKDVLEYLNTAVEDIEWRMSHGRN